LQISPSTFFGRAAITTYLRDADGQITHSVTSSPWTQEDRDLMIAWRQYRDSLCPGCGHPKKTAWHHHSSDSFELEGYFVCWACTAQKEPDANGEVELEKYPVVVDTRDYTVFPLAGPPVPISD
jgi:hypothetical protein